MFLSFVLLIMMISSHQVTASDSNESSCICSTVQDVVFVIDTSGSTGDDNFEMIRQFTANVTTELIHRSPSSAVGVILFSNNAHIRFNLRTHTNLDTLLSAIEQLPYNSGNTNTAAALRLLLQTAQNGELGLRNYSLNSAIVITDGESSYPLATRAAANRLHRSNLFDVYSVGVGRASLEELNRIASSPEFVFFTSSFNTDGLQQLSEELLPHLCKDIRTASLSQPQYVITENSGFLPVTITLNNTVCEDVIVEVTISNGSANAGVDYALSSALVFNITISAGSTSSSFSINIINDMIQEHNETFNIAIRLLPSCLSILLGTSSSTVMITDDEVAMIDFTSPTFSGSESDEVVSVQVMILGGIVSSRDIHVVITLISITAKGNNMDFNSTIQTVTIVAGTNNTTVNISVNNDGILEGDEMFNITLSIPSSLNGAGVVLANYNAVVSATGVIVDTTNTGAVSLSQLQYVITENSSFLPVNITLNSTASEDVIVEVTISDGSANAGVDYAMSSALVFNVTISAGSTSSLFGINITNDMIQEDNETFNITIRLLPSCLSLSLDTSSSTVMIIDDEVAMIDFASPTFDGSESDEVVSVQVMILGGIISSRDIYVVITLISITAEGNNTDFNSTMQTVMIVAGTNSTTVNIPVIDDGIAEGDEMFNITLSLPSSLNGAGVVLANNNAIVSATGIIIDNTITIDSTFCDDLYAEFQVSEETGCSPYEYDNLTSLVEQVCEITTVNELTATLELLTAELVLLTNERDDGTSACPNDLRIIVLLLEFIVNTTETYSAVLSSQDIIENTTEVFSNILSPLNNPGWIELLRMDEPIHIQNTLLHSERFGILLPFKLDGDGSVELDNIEIATVLVRASSTEDISSFNPAIENSILIPEEFIYQRSLMTGIDPIPITTIKYENIHNILPVTSNGTHDIQPVSPVLSSQVTNTNDTSSDVTVQLNLHYSLENVSALSKPRCGFWSFQRGIWDTTGITTISDDMNSSIIICNSTHLTSFAVLVDVSGSQQNNKENQALSIVSYIGCGISLICLLIAIILLVYYRRTIFKEMQNFIHLNLAIALSLALVVFVSGIQTATENDIACTVVAALLHYFFTAVFAWMLCEGILLYFLLVKVFNIGLGQKKWLYLALGWGIPVPIVAISVGIAHDQYGNDDFCWIGTDEGAIWGFVAPMIAIIIVNLIFLVLALHSLYKSETRRMKTEEVTRAQTIRTLLKISVILLPLLGITWMFGILAVNQETSVFAWIFTVLNSLQGMFILVFQVLRNEKLRQKFTGCCKRDKYDISSNSQSKERHIAQTRTKTSATTLSGFNTVDKLTNEEGFTDSVFKDSSTAENGLKSKSVEVVKDQNASSNLSEMYNKEGSVTSFQASTAVNNVA